MSTMRKHVHQTQLKSAILKAEWGWREWPTFIVLPTGNFFYYPQSSITFIIQDGGMTSRRSDSIPAKIRPLCRIHDIAPLQQRNRDKAAQKKQSVLMLGYSYLQSKQGEPIPDSIGTKRFSSYAVLIQTKKWSIPKWVPDNG